MGKDDHRPPPQTGRTILVAIFVFLLCAVASAFLAAYQRDTIDHLIRMVSAVRKAGPATPLPPPMSNKHARLTRQLVLTQRLGDPAVIFRDAAFSQADKFASTDFCSLLGSAFPELQLTWAANALFADTSDCTGELNASPATDTTTAEPEGTIHNSLFFQTRRNLAGGSTAVRLKLVYKPERMEQSYKAPFERGAELVLEHLFGADAAGLMNQVGQYRNFNTEFRGISIKFFEEQLVPGAFNLMIEGRCGKYHCEETNPYYKLNQPVVEVPPAATEGEDPAVQQE
jgi:hypothetical protein